jgi:general secretion pathway protein H
MVVSVETSLNPSDGNDLAVRHREARQTAGFTLLEIAVVLFIMGLMLAIAVPYFGGVANARLKAEARILAGRMNYLFDEAVAKKLVLRLTFDIDHNVYFVSRLDPYQPMAVFSPEKDPLMGMIRLPNDIRIRDVTIGGIGSFSSGKPSCLFYPSGWADAAMIHLINRNGVVFTLTVSPLTGQVSISAGAGAADMGAADGQ